MVKKEKMTFPKDFFSRPRPTVTTKDTFNDINPINWSEKVLSRKKKTIVYSAKEKKIL